MAGWKNSYKQARLLEEKAVNFFMKEFEERDDPPNLSQMLGACDVLRKPLREALKVNGIQNSMINAIRMISFQLAVLENSYSDGASRSDREICKGAARAATNSALKSSRRFVDSV